MFNRHLQTDRPESSVTVTAVGDASVELIDDVFTNTRHSLRPGANLGKSGNGDGDWEPKPLPGPAAPSEPAAKEGGGEEGWTPKGLPKTDPAGIEIVADTTSVLDVPPTAFETLRRGETVKVRLLQANEIRLSDLSGLPQAAEKAPGRLVVELHGDG
jgi:hypothetical protein